MNKGTKNAIVAVLAVSAAAMSVYFALVGRSTRIDLDPYEVLGVVTAEETAKLIGDKGQVLAIVRDTGPDLNPSVEAELKAVARTLKQRPGTSLEIQRVVVPPLAMMSTGGGVPADQFLKALEAHPSSAAVILFFGFPELTAADEASLAERRIKMVVVSSFRPGYQQLIERGLIDLAIVPRNDALPPTGAAPITVRERFDQQFSLVTAAKKEK